MNTKNKRFSDYTVNNAFIELYVRVMKAKGCSDEEINKWYKEKRKKLLNL